MMALFLKRTFQIGTSCHNVADSWPKQTLLGLGVIIRKKCACLFLFLHFSDLTLMNIV